MVIYTGRKIQIFSGAWACNSGWIQASKLGNRRVKIARRLLVSRLDYEHEPLMEMNYGTVGSGDTNIR